MLLDLKWVTGRRHPQPIYANPKRLMVSSAERPLAREAYEGLADRRRTSRAATFRRRSCHPAFPGPTGSLPSSRRGASVRRTDAIARAGQPDEEHALPPTALPGAPAPTVRGSGGLYHFAGSGNNIDFGK